MQCSAIETVALQSNSRKNGSLDSLRLPGVVSRAAARHGGGLKVPIRRSRYTYLELLAFPGTFRIGFLKVFN